MCVILQHDERASVQSKQRPLLPFGGTVMQRSALFSLGQKVLENRLVAGVLYCAHEIKIPHLLHPRSADMKLRLIGGFELSGGVNVCGKGCSCVSPVMLTSPGSHQLGPAPAFMLHILSSSR